MASHHGDRNYTSTRSRARQPAIGARPRVGALGKYGRRGPPDRRNGDPETINRDFSRSFLRHFNNASVASSQPHLWDDCLPASVRFDGYGIPFRWGFQRVYLEGGSDARIPALVILTIATVLDGGTVRAQTYDRLIRFACMFTSRGGPTITIAATRRCLSQRVGIGPRPNVRHQSIFCLAWKSPRGLSAASPRLLKRMTI